MELRVDGGVICLAVIVVIFTDTTFNRQRLNFRGWLFSALCVLTALLTALEMTGGRALSGIVLSSYVYPLELSLLALISAGWYYYVDTLSIGIRRERFRHYIANIAPILVCLTLVLLNGAGELLFKLTPSGARQNGELFWLYSACVVFYYLSSYAAVIMGHAIARRSDVLLMYSLPALLCGVYAVYAYTGFVTFACAGYTVLLLVAFCVFQCRDGIIDELTGLQNRKGLLESIRRPLGGMNESFTAIVVDLGNYKRYNEIVGYALGDRTLTNIARYLSKEARPGKAFRYSGTSFVLILTGDGRENARARVEDIREKLSRPLLTGSNTEYALSFRLGMIESDGSIADEDYIMGAIDSLVSQKAGGICVTRLDAECAQSINHRKAVMTALHNAIENDNITVHYQPIYCVSTGKFDHAEALLRVSDPELEWIPAKEVVAAADEMGWASYITYSVLERVCCFMAHSGDRLANKKFAVNISAKCFDDDTFAERLIRIITETHTDPRRLVFEVQEKECMENLERATAIFKRLTDYGISIALDDFMLGNSPVLALMELPVFAVKVDGSVLAATNDNPMLLSSILTMLKRMGKQIVVKDAETREQCSLLRRLNCDHIQGYFFARPMSGEELLNFDNSAEAQFGAVRAMEF